MKNWKIQHKIDDDTLLQLLALDKSVYAGKDVGSFELCKKWLNVNSKIYTVLKYKDEVVGYINFVPLKDDVFEKFERGEIKDYDLTENDITPFVKDKPINCLLMSIVIKKALRDGEAIIQLTNAFTKFLLDLKLKGVHIKKVIQDCVSIDGIKFALYYFGMKYVRDSHRKRGIQDGKIYEVDCDEQRYIYPPKLRYEEICQNNLKVASQIQYLIFNEAQSAGYSDYKNSIYPTDRFKNRLLPLDYLVYYRDKPVGVVGLYLVDGYDDDIWVDWLGVLPKYRNRGIGTQMLIHICEIARQYNRKYLRLYSFGNTYPLGIRLYKKVMQFSEDYRNTDDNPQWLEAVDCEVYSSSLIDKRPPLWRDKFIDANNELVIHAKSINMLKHDHILDDIPEF